LAAAGGGEGLGGNPRGIRGKLPEEARGVGHTNCPENEKNLPGNIITSKGSQTINKSGMELMVESFKGEDFVKKEPPVSAY